MIHLSEDLLVLHYYGEVRGGEVETHLDACENCRIRYRSLQRVLNTVDSYPVPERDPAYGGRVWQRLEGQLPVRARPRFNWFGMPVRWVAAGAMAMLLMGAFLAGRFSNQRAPRRLVVAGLSQPSYDSRILLTAVGNHLDRSQIVLVELANSGKAGDLGSQQDDIRDLIDANRLYRSSASQAGEVAVSDVLDELERLLVEVAHLAPSLTPEAAEELRNRIMADGILLRVRIVGSEVRERERNTDLAGKTSL